MKTIKTFSTLLLLMCCAHFAKAQFLCGVDANFYYGLNPSQIPQFHDSSTVAAGWNIVSYHWDFGDGHTSTLQNPTHSYSAGGIYTVCEYVTATSSGMTCIDTFCNIITVGNPNPCGNIQANFTVNQTGSLVSLQSTSTGTPIGTLYQWWVDGNAVTSPTSNNTYPITNLTSGIHTFCLYVYANANTFCDSICRTDSIGGNPCQNFAVNISWIPDTVQGGFHVQATPTTGTPPFTYVWSNNSISQVIHVTQSGVYCLSVMDANSCFAYSCDTVGGNSNPCGSANLTAQWTPIYNSNASVSFLSAQPQNTGTHIWVFGDGTTSTLRNPTHCYLNGGLYTVMHIVYISGTICADTIIHTIQVNPCNNTPPIDTLCGIVFNDSNGNGVLDGNETGIPNAQVLVDSTLVLTDSFGHYSVIVSGGAHHIRVTVPSGCLLTLPLNSNNISSLYGSYYTPAFNSGGQHCGYNFGINCNVVHICGTVYFDANNNGVQDSTEAGIPNVRVSITGINGTVVRYVYTDQNGNYCATLPAGTYMVTVTLSSNTYQGGVVTPHAITVNATTAGNTYSGNNFAVYVQPGACNLSIQLTPHTTVTAGFPAWYGVQVCNVGASVSDGEVNLFYDNAVTYSHSSPSASSQNSSTRTVTWNFTNLFPGQCKYYWVVFNADTNIALNQFVFTLASVTPGLSCNDINLANNVDTIHQAVTGSWDPNNKLAYKTNYETNPAYQWVSSVNADQKIHYVINFQNTGNAPAVNVVVKDVVSPDLDLNNFELLGTSHAGVVTRNGNELNFKFSNIMLPDSMHDEPNSHGWIKFSVNAVNGLPNGHIISDDADIYFDYNLPITTNDAAVILLDASSVDEVPNNVTVVIAPNPMSEFAQITLNNSQAENFRFRVIDLTGRLIDEKLSNGNTLQFNRNSLAAGLYTFQIIQNNKVVAKGKLVMQ